MPLHGGGHLELKKMHKGDFLASSELVWGDVQVSFLKKTAFCNFIPGSCVFFTNALALLVDQICTRRKWSQEMLKAHAQPA